MADTIAAIATGTQVSAIGIIRLSGDETFRVIDRLFFPYSGKKMSESADRRLIFGELRDRGGELLDVCLCTISRLPRTEREQLIQRRTKFCSGSFSVIVCCVV